VQSVWIRNTFNMIDLLSQIINLKEAVTACWTHLVPVLHILCYLVSFIGFLYVLFGGCWVNTWFTTFIIIPTNLKTVISFDGSTLNWLQQNRNNWNRCSQIWQTQTFCRCLSVCKFTVCFSRFLFLSKHFCI
jgi:hypothetical protein